MLIYQKRQYCKIMLKSSVCEKGTPRVGTIIFSGCLASNGFGMVRVAP